MNSGTSRYVVFDHDHGMLEHLSVAAGFLPVEADDDLGAATELSVDTWTLAFVHIDPEPWSMLCKSISEQRIVIRFSTQGFPPTPPQGKEMLGLHCLKRTIDLQSADIMALAAVGGRADIIAEFRAGRIPPSVQALIAFEEPHRLRALHILLQGVLALWASDPGHANYQHASRLLGIVSIPTLPERKVTQISLLWRGLGVEVGGVVKAEKRRDFIDGISRELGIRDLSEERAIERLVSHILESRETDDIDPDAVLSGFEAIDRILSKS